MSKEKHYKDCRYFEESGDCEKEMIVWGYQFPCCRKDGCSEWQKKEEKE